MKKYILFSLTMFCATLVYAQPDPKKYPEPEFSKEVYYLKKDSINTAVRLEKESSKMEAKTKLGGFGGFENGYLIDGEKSTVRLNSGNRFSFIFSNGTLAKSNNRQTDSIMAANGMDPGMMSGMMDAMNDPASTISLYKTESVKGNRKILMQKSGGAVPFASKKVKSSDKYTFSVKKIREGYWELVIDKPLLKGEYAFSMMNMGMGNADGSIIVFAFGID